ncbi:MAG: T9SS type A sorting domain-containing protein [bacterium]
MLKKLSLFLFLLVAVSTLNAQVTVDLKTHGISPRQADLSEDDIFNTSFNGLLNVGVGTKIYLKGIVEGGELNNPTWTLPVKPAASAAAFGATQNEETSAQYISFIPDVVGTYQIEFEQDGAIASVTLNAAMYLGAETALPNCGWCHKDHIAKWKTTGHSSTLIEGLDGTLSSHFGESCLKCHTTGNDANAVNDGFDDFDFVFPAVLEPGVYEATVAAYPEAMARGNVQCESCHGPGGNHLSLTHDSRMIASLDASVCAYCHDEGVHHNALQQLDNSKHGVPEQLSYAGGRSGCSNCHSGSGFVAWLKNGQQNPAVIPEPQPITCAACHDPHDASNPGQLRIVTATLTNGYEIPLSNEGRLCITCHKSRRDAITYTDAYLKNLSAHYGPHYSVQGDILAGQNMPTWGRQLPTSPHLQAIEKACVGCHMADAGEDAEGNMIIAGNHTFSMFTAEGAANVAACEPCHGDIGETFAEKKLYLNGKADHDGDGVEEGLQEEVHGLLHELALLLPPKGSEDVAVIDSSWTLDEARALYIYNSIEEDRSFGHHNPEYVVELLNLAIDVLNGVVGVEPIDNSIPTTYELSQNYPNPFNPSTTIEFSLPEATNVKIVIYDAIGNQVTELINENMLAGKFSARWNASNVASGVYFYKIITNKYVETKKMLLLK